MGFDPLAPFRTKAGPPGRRESDTTADAEGKYPYEAFGTQDRLRTIDILAKGGEGHSISYQFLVDRAFHWLKYDQIQLLFSNIHVQIDGENLRPVMDALRRNNCSFVQEFDPGVFQVPQDQNTPLITSITVTPMVPVRGVGRGDTNAGSV